MAETTVEERLDRIEAALDKTRIPGELAEELKRYGVPYTRTPVDNTSRYLLSTQQGMKPGTIALSISDQANGIVLWHAELSA